MIRSMLAAVSGLRSHQQFLDVIGNNIANVNTVGFKSTRMLFSDIMSQLTRGASSPEAGKGGTDPLQIGLGMQVAGTDTLQTQGNFQSTGKITDLAIQGEGFFVLNDGNTNHFTRDGSFDVASDGTIVNPATGLRVQGWVLGANGTIDTTQPVSAITIPFSATMAGQPSTAVTVRGNLDSGLNGVGTVTQSNTSGGAATLTGVYQGVAAASYSVKVNAAPGGVVTSIDYSVNGGAATTVTPPDANGFFDIGNGLKIAVTTSASNAAADTYSFNVTPPKVQSNVGVYDSLGTLHNITITYQKTGANTWSWTASSNDPGVTCLDAITGNPPTGTLDFSPTGTYTGQRPAGTIPLTLFTDGASDETLTLDLSGLTQLSGTSEAHATADGAAAGSLTSFSIGQSGDVEGVYSNGLSKQVGQIALAKFSNSGGLQKEGNNLFQITANSGEVAIGAPGTGGRGQVSSGYLEMSNVDLALQFTNMIMAERGFQANSRVITTSDEMLQDLVNLKR